MPPVRKNATPAQVQPVTGRVVVNLFGQSPLELLATEYGDSQGYVLSVGGTLLVGLTAESAAAWIDVLQVIVDPEGKGTTPSLSQEDAEDIVEEITTTSEETSSADRFGQGRRSGLDQAVRIIKARLIYRKKYGTEGGRS